MVYNLVTETMLIKTRRDICYHLYEKVKIDVTTYLDGDLKDVFKIVL